MITQLERHARAAERERSKIKYKSIRQDVEAKRFKHQPVNSLTKEYSMKLLKVTMLFVLPLVVPMMLAGCGGSEPAGENKSSDSGSAPESQTTESKPAAAESTEGKTEKFAAAGIQFKAPAGWTMERRERWIKHLPDGPDWGNNVNLARCRASRAR